MTTRPDDAAPDIVQLSYGSIRGRRCDDGSLVFRGIPYAAPPVGELRWRAPVPPEPWTGIRDATEPGNPAPQLAQAHADLDAVDEDCLTLEVTVPDQASAGRLTTGQPTGGLPTGGRPNAGQPNEGRPTGGRPVMVWLHGGGGTNGTGSLYGARRLATSGDVIVVSPNYRLGILGSFGFPGLADSGTFGLLDQQEVLRWVRREIAAFGGDPDNVTLFGESYGGLTVAAHLASPASAGLFHRAILQSAFGAVGGIIPAHTFIPGLPELPPRWVPVDELTRFGAATAAEHGWVKPDSDPDSALARLRQVPVAELLRAGAPFIRPAYGTAALPESPEAALRTGRFNRTPVIVGGTSDEARFFVGMFADLVGNPVTPEAYVRMAGEAFGDAAEDVLARYPLDRFDTPGLAWARICTDRAWTLPAAELGRVLAARVPTWFYEFADEQAPAPVPIPGMPTGAQHGSELSYQFELAGAAPLPGPQGELAEQLNRYWTSFARYGDPATDGLPDWPEFGTGHVQRLAPGNIGGTDLVADHQLEFWSSMDVGAGA